MAQHMIRDIQTLLSRMEVSGQGWPLSACLTPSSLPLLSQPGDEGMTAHIHWILFF